MRFRIVEIAACHLSAQLILSLLNRPNSSAKRPKNRRAASWLHYHDRGCHSLSACYGLMALLLYSNARDLMNRRDSSKNWAATPPADRTRKTSPEPCDVRRQIDRASIFDMTRLL